LKYFIIGDEDTVLGFGMVGVDGTIVRTADEARIAIKNAINDRSIGIIIITERIANFIRETVDRYIFTLSFPLIVEIPDRTGPMKGRKNIRDAVNTAIGIKL